MKATHDTRSSRVVDSFGKMQINNVVSGPRASRRLRVEERYKEVFFEVVLFQCDEIPLTGWFRVRCAFIMKYSFDIVSIH